jgi:CBS domain-containing protein
VNFIQLNKRQNKIIDIVKNKEPITSEQIADILNVTRATLRADLSILTMTGILEARPKVGYLYTGKGDINFLSSNYKEKKAEEVMSLPAIAKKDDSVYDVIVTMFLSDVGTVVIVDENDFVCGIVSRKDLLKSTIGGTDVNKMPVGLIMTRMPNLITVTRDDTILTATKRMIQHEIDSLPVVDYIDNDINKMKAVGRISKTTIAKLFLEIINS